MTSNVTRQTEIVIRNGIDGLKKELADGFGWSDIKWIATKLGPDLVAAYKDVAGIFTNQKDAEKFIKEALYRVLEILKEEKVYEPSWLMRTFVIPFLVRAAASNLASLVNE